MIAAADEAGICKLKIIIEGDSFLLSKDTGHNFALRFDHPYGHATVSEFLTRSLSDAPRTNQFTATRFPPPISSGWSMFCIADILFLFQSQSQRTYRISFADNFYTQTHDRYRCLRPFHPC